MAHLYRYLLVFCVLPERLTGLIPVFLAQPGHPAVVWFEAFRVLGAQREDPMTAWFDAVRVLVSQQEDRAFAYRSRLPGALWGRQAPAAPVRVARQKASIRYNRC